MSGNQGRSVPSKGRGTKKTSRSSPKSSQRTEQGHVCQEPGCTKVCKSPAGLVSHRRQAHPTAPPVGPESPTAAVERVLAELEPTARRAVLAATVRELAKALEDCEPTDKAKTSKELSARMADLLADTTPDAGPDWTEDEDE